VVVVSEGLEEEGEERLIDEPFSNGHGSLLYPPNLKQQGLGALHGSGKSADKLGILTTFLDRNYGCSKYSAEMSKK
jgi:hypothetical protein